MKRQVAIIIMSFVSLFFSTYVNADVGDRETPTIQSAIDAASNNDVIIIPNNRTYTGFGNVDLDFKGKKLTLISSGFNPDDPDWDIVASTIIDCAGSRDQPHRAIHFKNSGEDGSQVIGLTIINGYQNGGEANDANYAALTPEPYESIEDDAAGIPHAERGPNSVGDGYGGAIYCDGVSPIIKYCIIRDCVITGAQGSDGADGQDGTYEYLSPLDTGTGTSTSTSTSTSTDTSTDTDTESDIEEVDDGQWGGHGGDGDGTGYGGAIACRNGSNITIIDCIVSNNSAHGGRGGDGGDGGNAKGATFAGGDESSGGDAGISIGEGIGGAIYCDGASNAIITDCNFINNFATVGLLGKGGDRGLGNAATNPPVQDGNDGTFLSNGQIYGGAIYYEGGSDPNINNSTFTGNQAYDVFLDFETGFSMDFHTFGGAVFSAGNSKITINNSEFSNNKGGAVYHSGGHHAGSKISNTVFNDNSETGQGGALYIGRSNNNIVLENCSFGGNSAHQDGGAFKCESDADLTNCSFGNNTAEDGYGGAMDAYTSGQTLILNFNSCNFSGNQSVTGGGLSSENFKADFNNCYFIDNEAERGGGLDLVNGLSLSFEGGSIQGNESTDGSGGGLNCSSRPGNKSIDIRNCKITDNSAEGVGGFGGGINFEGGVNNLAVFNCLLTSNSAVVDGGAISWFTPSNIISEIRNCTFSDNAADNGGGVFVSSDSDVNIVDSIFQRNNGHAIYEEDGNGNATTTYSLFYENTEGDYYDSGTDETYTGSSGINNIPGGAFNIYSNPLFTTGSLGAFYLTQTSQAVDAGSVLASNVGLNTYTTSKTDSDDTGQVDIGYHFFQTVNLVPFKLSLSVVNAQGIIGIDPSMTPVELPNDSNYPFYPGAVVKLVTTPDSGWLVKGWNGTLDDSSIATTNFVVMNSDKQVSVEFKQPTTLYVAVGGGSGFYVNIQDALHDADDGDEIIVYPGIYRGKVIWVDKAVTIRSLNPDNPIYVDSTIIDRQGYADMAFRFTSNSKGAVLNGLTIQNCGGEVLDGYDAKKAGLNGGHGYGASGGAITISSGTDLVVKNCIIKENFIMGANGGNGATADKDHNAGRGGWGGWARGGAVYCGKNSEIEFINCEISDNNAIGGNGGNGGDEVIPGGIANYGGNWSTSLSVNIDPGNLNTYFVEGELWTQWDWYEINPKGDQIVNSGPYIGDYRRYSGYGGGVYCDTNSKVTFTNCTIRRNRAQGGMSGAGGDRNGEDPEPDCRYEIPSFGGGVYCGAGSEVTFTNCVLSENVSSDPNWNHLLSDGRLGTPAEDCRPYDPNNTYNINPYLGHGGGVSAENTASVTFTDCVFGENEASVGGGVHFADANFSMTDCSFVDNLAYHGGGAFGNLGTAELIGCDFTGNQAKSREPNDPNDPNSSSRTLGLGGALHFLAVDANIFDCSISDNNAEASGGGAYFVGENSPALINCLITNNTAGSGGGGVTANVFTQLLISNSTIANNTVIEDGHGGGLNCTDGSYTTIVNSIIWGNYASKGRQIGIGVDTSPSTVKVSYSDVEGGGAYVQAPTEGGNTWLDTNCNLIWDQPSEPNNLHGSSVDDPLFVEGVLGNYYLSQTAADSNDSDSPCVDKGEGDASSLLFKEYWYTTRKDRVIDQGQIDIGYHYPKGGAFTLGDLNYDGDVDSLDLAILFDGSFPEVGCSFPGWCQSRDFNKDGIVNFIDYTILNKSYGDGDIEPPSPDRSTWTIPPMAAGSDSITMQATTAVDNSGYDVLYYFECAEGNCSDRGWDPCSSYTDTGLDPGNPGADYGYKVRVADMSGENYDASYNVNDPNDPKVGNKTEWSYIGYAMPGNPQDTDPPTGLVWITVPYGIASYAIEMEAFASDVSGVQYFFECMTDGGHDSGWQDEPVYVDTGLLFETPYTYRVKARDESIWRNEMEEWSTLEEGITLEEGNNPPIDDFNSPTPNPSEWDIPPFMFNRGGGAFDYWVDMTAVEAIDEETNIVEYKFICSVSQYSSDWQSEPNYVVETGFITTEFYVKTRDGSPNQNETDPSPSLQAALP